MSAASEQGIPLGRVEVDQTTMSRADAAAAFNEWMRRFEADPAAFEEWAATLASWRAGDRSYGETCADLLFSICGDLNRPGMTPG